MQQYRIAFLGPNGTHTEAALQQFTSQAERISCYSIAEVFRLVSEKQVDAGFVPIENMLQGPVTTTLDLLLEYKESVRISASHLMTINNTLGVLPGNGNKEPLDKRIRQIYSHEQPLRQCSKYIRTRFPNAEICPMPSTGAAAEFVAEKNLSSAAVIALESTLRDKGFDILEADISDNPGNKTRFAFIEAQRSNVKHSKDSLASSIRSPDESTARYVTSIVIDPRRDRQGLLSEILDVISKEHQANLLSIHSRPDTKGGFVFHLDLEGSEDDPNIRDCLNGLQEYCEHITGQSAEIIVFGSYARDDFYSPPNREVGIIGGKGRMGTWFSNLLQGAGLEVSICDKDSTPSIGEIASKCDVLLLSLPMSSVSSIAEELCPLLKPGQLVVENCSIKNSSLPHLLRLAPPDVEVLGIHTMFAGDLADLRGENIIITKTERSGPKAQSFEDLLYKYGAKITYANSDEHDQMAALQQSLIQLMLISLGEVLSTSFDSAENLDVFSTPNSRAVLQTMSRVLRQNDKLLLDLQTLNDKSAAIRHCFQKVVSELVSSLDKNEIERILESVEKTRVFLGIDK